MNWINLVYVERRLTLKRRPFPHLVFSDFLNSVKAKELLKALPKESFELKEADLFRFWQTKDLRYTKNKLLLEFYAFLASKECISFMEKVVHHKLKSGKIDMAGTKYVPGNYLLPHDDRLEGRKIAYFLYLSEVEGGELELFQGNKVEARIIPKFNTFAFFVVSDTSIHQVTEVLKGERWAISGWFYG